VFALTLLPILSGCVTTMSSSAPATKVTCAAFSPILWSKKDTDKTLAQIKEYNAVFKSLCMPGENKK